MRSSAVVRFAALGLGIKVALRLDQAVHAADAQDSAGDGHR